MIKILGKASSINVRKVLWTCIELDVKFEREDWGSGFQSTSAPQFIAMNPNAMVPVLVDDAFVLWESNTICRYLCNLHEDPALLPVEPQARALVEQWMDWQATELNNAWRYSFMGLVRGSAAHSDPKEIALSISNWNGLIGILNHQLAKTGRFVTGEHFTLADVVLGLSVHRWLSMPMERPSYPAIEAYYKRLCERPGFNTFGLHGGV
nr:glutathione S-transferase [uncultured Enterobacter sp.]